MTNRRAGTVEWTILRPPVHAVSFPVRGWKAHALGGIEKYFALCVGAAHAAAGHPTVSPPPASPESPASVDHARWFAEAVQPHEPALRAYLQRRYPTLPDVDDVVQESFLKTFLARKLGRLTSARGFLFHVARNSAVTFFRRRKFISPTSVSELHGLRVVDCDSDVVESVCTRDELDLISDAVARLPERCRAIVLLRLTQGLEYAAIARQLDLSEATVRVQMARGMTKCSEFLRSRGVLDEEESA
jgi:RNA polymerase sigma-70 factor (ECF subfamily)